VIRLRSRVIRETMGAMRRHAENKPGSGARQMGN
jgi:hypothetical protein